jgi:hypothetical protein
MNLAAMETTFETLRSLPWAAHALVVVAMIGGIVLWLFGRVVLRPVSVVLFAALGGALGLLVVTLTALGTNTGVLSGVLVGMAVGAGAGLLLFRFAMAVGFSLVLGTAAPMAAAILLDVVAPRSPDDDWDRGGDAWAERDGSGGTLALEDQYLRGVQRYEEMRKNLGESGAGDSARAAATADDPEARRAAALHAASAAGEHVRAFASAVRDEAVYRWEGLSGRDRLVLGVGSVGGAALGFLLGLAMPGWAAGAASAMIGSLVWLAAGVWLLRAADAPGQGVIDSVGARGWLAAWAVASAAGMIVQWRRGRRAEPAEEA